VCVRVGGGRHVGMYCVRERACVHVCVCVCWEVDTRVGMYCVWERVCVCVCVR